MIELKTQLASSGDDRWTISLWVSAWSGIIAPVLFLLVLTIDGFLRPGYSAMSQRGSDLGVGSNAWIFISDLTVFGVLLMIFAIGFYQIMRSTFATLQWRAVVVLLILAGIGALIAGFFTEDNPLMHALGANLLFLLPGVAQIMVGRKLSSIAGWQSYARYSLITGPIAIVLSLFGVLHDLLKLIPALVPFNTLMNTQIGGIYQRINLAVIFAWYVVSGCMLLAKARGKQVADRRKS